MGYNKQFNGGKSDRQAGRNSGINQWQQSAVATAPYNFVKINKRVVPAPLADKLAGITDEKQKSVAFMHFINESGKYSGYFAVDIKNITPLYIGSEEGFFSDGVNYYVPGSSMRGCLKNIFKIITCSSFRSDKDNPDLSDHHLYFRTLAGKFNHARKNYADRMITADENGKARSKAMGGFLVREGSNYFIVPADVEAHKGIYVDWHKKKPGDYPGKDIRVYVGVKASVSLDGTYRPCVRWHNKYVDIFTGNIQDKKTFYRIGNPHWNRRIKVTKEMIEDYRNDNSRGRYNLLETKEALNGAHLKKVTYNYNPYACIECIPYEMAQKGKLKRPIRIKNFYPDKNLLRNEINSQKARYFGCERPADNITFLKDCAQYDHIIPCFYTADGDVLTGFGASPYFRVPYQKKISDHIMQIDSDIIDLADAVFGNKGEWAGRVFFEDMVMTDGRIPEFEAPALHKVLSTPNPTSFQLYLETKNGDAQLWDDDTRLRGYKLYWHKNEDWRASADVKRQMTEEIAPLKKGQTFAGRIRFENLDAVELGAMCALFALGKENGICYKLGGGKPIGMGTVKLKGELVLQGDNYYKKLFDDKGFAECQSENGMDVFLNRFYTYMENKLNETGQLNLYNERMKELRMIMATANINNDKWTMQTRYMTIDSDKNTYSERIPLPTIEEVCRKK